MLENTESGHESHQVKNLLRYPTSFAFGHRGWSALTMASTGAAGVSGGNLLVTTELAPPPEGACVDLCGHNGGETERAGGLTGPFCAAGPELSPVRLRRRRPHRSLYISVR